MLSHIIKRIEEEAMSFNLLRWKEGDDDDVDGLKRYVSNFLVKDRSLDVEEYVIVVRPSTRNKSSLGKYEIVFYWNEDGHRYRDAGFDGYKKYKDMLFDNVPDAKKMAIKLYHEFMGDPKRDIRLVV